MSDQVGPIRSSRECAIEMPVSLANNPGFGYSSEYPLNQ